MIRPANVEGCAFAQPIAGILDHIRDLNTAARKRSPPELHLLALIARPAILEGCDFAQPLAGILDHIRYFNPAGQKRSPPDVAGWASTALALK